jgi:hypothetical protein
MQRDLLYAAFTWTLKPNEQLSPISFRLITKLDMDFRHLASYWYFNFEQGPFGFNL